jgi:hypothetical protein
VREEEYMDYVRRSLATAVNAGLPYDEGVCFDVSLILSELNRLGLTVCRVEEVRSLRDCENCGNVNVPVGEACRGCMFPKAPRPVGNSPSLISCVSEELNALKARYRHGEPLKLLQVLPSAYHHWQWLRRRSAS